MANTKGFQTNITEATRSNEAFRRVLHTTPGGQLVVMHLQPGEDIGLETHDDVDQYIWIVQGLARATLDGQESTNEPGDVVVIPRGTRHNVLNASSEQPLKLFTVYTPAEHPDGTIHQTRAEAEAAEAAHHA